MMFRTTARIASLSCMMVLLAVPRTSAPAAAETAAAAPGSDAAALEARVKSCLVIAHRPSEIRWARTGILWLVGKEQWWQPGVLSRVRQWVAEGRVCWVNVALATRLGLATGVGGSVGLALPAAGSEGDPLLDGVRQVVAADTFRYVVGVPDGARAILVASNKPEHVVLAAWPIGKGLLVIRPEPRPAILNWRVLGERRWVEPDVADGGRLLRNLNAVSLDVLERSGFWVPPARAPRPARVTPPVPVPRPAPVAVAPRAAPPVVRPTPPPPPPATVVAPAPAPVPVPAPPLPQSQVQSLAEAFRVIPNH